MKEKRNTAGIRLVVGDPVPDRGSGVGRLLDEIDWTRVGHRFGLSPREIQVLQSSLEGKSLAQIAEYLGLAVGTVKGYSGRMHLKLGVKNPCQLTLVVLHAGIESIGTSS